jgi:hypothetical protein
MDDFHVSYREIPNPEIGEIACPRCGGNLRADTIHVINAKDPLRSLVSLGIGYPLVSPPEIKGIMIGAELVNPPTKQGVMIGFGCRDCYIDDLHLVITYEPDTRFCWRYLGFDELPAEPDPSLADPEPVQLDADPPSPAAA